MSKKDKSFGFAMGILGGIVGGIIAGILYAPKSGKETREDIKDCVKTLAETHAPHIEYAKKQAMESIDLVKFKIEKQYNKINEHIKAKQMAKARELEDRSYDFN